MFSESEYTVPSPIFQERESAPLPVNSNSTNKLSGAVQGSYGGTLITAENVSGIIRFISKYTVSLGPQVSAGSIATYIT